MVTAPRRDPESGQALVLALVATLLLTAALALAAGTLVSRMQRAQRTADRTDLLALTDAAVAETLANLAAWPSSAGVEPRSLGEGTLRSRVERGGGKSFTIIAEATVRRGRMAVGVKGRLTEHGPAVDSWRRLPPAVEETGGGFQGELRRLGASVQFAASDPRSTAPSRRLQTSGRSSSARAGSSRTQG